MLSHWMLEGQGRPERRDVVAGEGSGWNQSSLSSESELPAGHTLSMSHSDTQSADMVWLSPCLITAEVPYLACITEICLDDTAGLVLARLIPPG